ncbi:hypothetical protein F5148DRAFT_205097 [Russula earlei]|uniref:Uncharacterized protein n=1 Tax=Russula earlei TaxID=71964 RepID=A0ACC0U4J0_9AGAM|nr:hypothetical protein F5148DRAFT_205097 [Russula earlei]
MHPTRHGPSTRLTRPSSPPSNRANPRLRRPLQSGAHPLQHPLPPESPRCDPSLTSRLPVTELGHLSSHSPGLRGLDSMFRFPPAGGDLLYTMDDGLDVEQAALMTHKSTPVVKEEQEDGSVTAAFVFESSPSTPGPASEGPRETQVPLRATQATKAMRKMMSVFRLNPFAVQGSAPTVEEAGPLEEEGRLFEFQLRLGDSPPPSSPPVRSASTLPESRTTSPSEDWMGRARPPSELGNRRMVEWTPLGREWDWTPSPRYGPYSQGTQSPSGRGGAHNCGYGYGAVAEQGHRRYSGAQRDPSRPATPGSSYATVFETSWTQWAVSIKHSIAEQSRISIGMHRWEDHRHHILTGE